MNRPAHHDDALIADPIDHLLDEHLAAESDQVAPSSGFVLSVMDSIHAQATEPPPIAFPWRRVLPGIAAVLCGLIALALFASRTFHASVPTVPAHPHLPAALTLMHDLTSAELTLLGIALAACLSLAAIAASFRLTRGNE